MNDYSILELQNKALEDITSDRLPIVSLAFPFYEAGEVTHWVALGSYNDCKGIFVISNNRIIFLVKEALDIAVEIPYESDGLPTAVESLSDGIVITDKNGTHPFHLLDSEVARLIFLKASLQRKANSQES